MIVITGASKGIGRYLFEEFKRRGECVVGTYHSTPVVAVELSKTLLLQQLTYLVKSNLLCHLYRYLRILKLH